MILITGASGGLGAEIAVELARRNHSLLLHYCKRLKNVEGVAARCRAFGVSVELLQGDFSLPETTDDFIRLLDEKNYPIKGVVNNVGDYFLGTFEKTSHIKWRALFESNLHAPY